MSKSGQINGNAGAHFAQFVTDDQMRECLSVMLEPFVAQLYKVDDMRAMFRVLLEVLAGGDVEVRDGKLYLDIEWLNGYMAERLPEIVKEEEERQAAAELKVNRVITA